MFYAATQKLHTATSLSFCDHQTSAACRGTEIKSSGHSVPWNIREMDVSVMFNDRITSQ